MKRLFLFILVLSVSAFVFAQTPAAVIRELTGTVELQRAGSSNWVPASVGDRIDIDTIVSTGFRSTAILAVGNSTLTVRPITRLSLRELTTQDGTEITNINLSTGRVRAEVNPPAGGRANFTLQSPTATASVRGTSFDMDTTSINVLSGAVSFAPTGSEARTVNVGAGQATVVDIETGTTMAPMIAAEAARSLPSLPGQAGIAAPGGASPITRGRGSFDLSLELVPNPTPQNQSR